MEKRVTKSALETKVFGKEIAQTLQGGTVITLAGDLGSGKTTFVQGFAEGLGITQRIISPTFIIMRSYEIEGRGKGKDQNRILFYHVDLYRTKTVQDIEGLGLLEIMEDENTIVVIEWPERLGKYIPEHARKITFRYISETEREIIYE